VLAELDAAITEAEKLARSEAVRERVHQQRVSLTFTEMVMDYLTKMHAEFEGVDRDDSKAVQAAYERAVAVGEPLSERIVEYCNANGIRVFDRLVRAHQNRRFIMPRPEDETLLR
jgi:metal-responsive CopG/Arc/MetJ family transcriptional regulator